MASRRFTFAAVALSLGIAACAPPQSPAITDATSPASARSPQALSLTRNLVTEIVIDAPPQAVWAVLTDMPAYAEWNPFISSMTGDLVEGETIENVLQFSEDRRMTIRPTVVKVEADRELRWLGRPLVPYLFDGEHYFQLEDTEGGTRLIHGERFHGIAIWFVDVEQFRPGFEAMNAALRHRVENISGQFE